MAGSLLRSVLFLVSVSGSFGSQANKDPHFVDGRTALVHLFEWRWDDIAAECERFLSPKGYAGIQVSPPNENLIIMDSGVQRPWYERYQPVSYTLTTRSGSEEQFADMVRRCNSVGVRIYVDAVINHMTGPTGGTKPGTAGNTADEGTLQFPGVPYGPNDFHSASDCGTASGGIEDWNDPNQIRNCRLVGLTDLNQGTDYVREQIRNYLNHLISLGVAGFRVDAAKHIWPVDLGSIYDGLNDLNTDFFPSGSKAFVYQEVIPGGVDQSEYTSIGCVTEFRVGDELTKAFRGGYTLSNLKTFGETWGFLGSDSAVDFVDNHDTQRDQNNLHFTESRAYKMAIAFLLAWPYAIPKVMSSFDFPSDANWQGPPHDGDYNTNNVPVNADDSCGGGWICEHRWRQIYNMVGFRNVVSGTGVNDWYDNGSNQIAFSRGDRGFLAMNSDGYAFQQTVHTGLPSGDYCDLITGNLVDGSCTGNVITVDGNGDVQLDITNETDDPQVAIHVEAKL